MNARALVVVVSHVLVCASACFEATPPSGLILCVDDADCPDGLTCLEARHTCAEKGTEATAPTIDSVRFDPPVARGGVVELIIVAKETLSSTVPAVVTFSPGLAAPPLSFAGTDNTEQRFVINADEVDEGGYVVEAVTVTDEDGDEATASNLSVGLVVDRTAPAVFNVAAVGPVDGVFADVAGRDALSVTALANEPVASAALDVGGVVDGCSVALTSLSCTSRPFTAERASSTATPVTLIVRDAAGNETRARQADITIDTDGPGVAADNVAIDVEGGGGVPGPGATVTLTVVADEDLGDAAADVAPLAFVENGDVRVAFSLQRRVGRRLIFVLDGDDVPLGVYNVGVTLEDVVGHVATSTLALPAPFGDGLAFTLSGPCPPAPGSSVCVDVDGDGHAGRVGCVEGDDDDDASILVFPGAHELPGDGVDNDQIAGDRAADAGAGVFCDVDAAAGGDGSPGAPFNDFDDCVDAVGSGDVLFLAKRDAAYAADDVDFLDGVSIVGGLTPGPTSWRRLRAGDRSTVEEDVLYGSAEGVLVGVETGFVSVRATDMVIADCAIATLVSEISDVRIEGVEVNTAAMLNTNARVALSDFGSYENIATGTSSTTMLRSIVRGKVRLDGPCTFVDVAVLAGGLTNEPALQHGAEQLTLVHSTIVGGAGPAVTAGNVLVAVGNVLVHTGAGPLVNGGPSQFSLRQNLFVGADRDDAVADFNGVCDGACVAFDDNEFADDAGFATLFHLDDASPARDAGVVVAAALAGSASADFDFDCRYADGSADYGADEFR